MSKARRTLIRFGLLVMLAANQPGQLTDAGQAGPAVVIDTGPVIGIMRHGQRHFLGIPFAAPPIGPSRWRPPQRVSRWSRPFRADHFGAICPQVDTYGLFARPSEQEDCLSLNVFAPARSRGRRPVMVWYHGGGLAAGSSADYDASALVAQGVVVVSVNYRLGLLGYFANPGLGEDNTSPNYGMLDQIAALRWVRRNIAAFGGDPGNVTIFGESAGARSVAALMVSPLAAGLFHRAIMESISYGNTSISREDAERNGRAVALKAGCEAGDARCLRQLGVKQLLQIQGKSGSIPARGGPDLPEAPQAAIPAGRFHRVPVLVGWNRDEATWQTALAEQNAGRPFTTDYVRQVARARSAGDAVRREKAVQLYMSTYNAPGLAASAIKTDADFICPTIRLMKSLSAYVPVYGYEFADRNAPQFNPPASFPYGASHTSELQYLFPGFHGAAGVIQPLMFRQARLARNMRRFWAEFARKGEPGVSRSGVRWLRYDPPRENLLVLATPEIHLRSSSHDLEYNCVLWRE